MQSTANPVPLNLEYSAPHIAECYFAVQCPAWLAAADLVVMLSSYFGAIVPGLMLVRVQLPTSIPVIAVTKHGAVLADSATRSVKKSARVHGPQVLPFGGMEICCVSYFPDHASQNGTGEKDGKMFCLPSIVAAECAGHC